jgi:phosphoribosylanthranilate isomerase
MTVKIQIYLHTAEDAANCVQAGVDFIGLVCDDARLVPFSMNYLETRQVFEAVPEGVMKVSLSVDEKIPRILDMVENTAPDVLHLAGRPLSVGQIVELRRTVPRVKIMQAISMNSEHPIKMACKYQSCCDYLILDTNNPRSVDIGATGKTHDWSISARLVRRVQIPVILAGGISPENVAEAVRQVRPWGVDSYTHTNIPGGSPVRKDLDRVQQFVDNARSALDEQE